MGEHLGGAANIQRLLVPSNRLPMVAVRMTCAGLACGCTCRVGRVAHLGRGRKRPGKCPEREPGGTLSKLLRLCTVDGVA